MAEIKINKKLTPTQLTDIKVQLSNNSIYILKALPENNKISPENIIGKVTRLMPIHSKVIAFAEMKSSINITKKDKFDIKELSDGYAIHLI